MVTSQAALAVYLLASCIFAAVIALSMFAYIAFRRADGPKPGFRERLPERAVFLFDDSGLVDATAAAMAILGKSSRPGPDWEKLVAYLTPRFPEIERLLNEVPENDRVRLTSGGASGIVIDAQRLGRVMRLELFDAVEDTAATPADPLSRRADHEELSDLREVVASAPSLAWRLDATGNVIWANRAYFVRAASHLEEAEDCLTWPLPKLIEVGAQPFPQTARRVRIASADAALAQWYDLHSQPSGDGSLHFASPADVTVKAETALREFVQTLTKTFAHLPIGLAIFDGDRKLALFNPALIDLTTLGADYLSSRPTLFSFLDRLRDARTMPEPKDYPSWRARMSELEKAAASGLYLETWPLPSGQTYRVTGRPHPGGAVAFFFEDISAEISLTRRFRSELELGQGVLDRIEDAVVVFSAAGSLVLSNEAYARLWGFDPGRTLTSLGIREAIALWQARGQQPEVWSRVAEFVLDVAERPDSRLVARLDDGLELEVALRPLPGGASMVSFRRVAAPGKRVAGAGPPRPARRRRFAEPMADGETLPPS